jgi:exopolysaccharide biosynthesis polyprenyl glycosylphosphotransferase
VGIDVAAVTVAWLAVGLLTTPLVGVPLMGLIVHGVEIIAFVLTAMVLVVGRRLHLARVCSVKTLETARLGQVAILTGALGLALGTLSTAALDMPSVLAGSVLQFVLQRGARSGYRQWLQTARKQGRFVRPVVVVGTNEEGSDLERLTRDHPELGVRVVGVVGRAPETRANGFGAPWLGGVEGCVDAVRRVGAGGVLVAASAVPFRQLNRLLRELLDAGVHVQLSSGLRGMHHRRMRRQHFAHEPLFYLEPAALHPWQLLVKRCIDLVLAALGLLVAAPVLAAAAVAIKLHDGGTVLFRQERIGLGGKPFTCLKLRTMVPDAERRVDELRARNQRSGPLFKVAGDPRVTPAGRVLRATSIDELPQLWNVLRGDMTLVGPRPCLPSEYELFSEELRQRTSVLPGITGLWQVEARDTESFSAYERLDAFYVENWSASLDVAILLATVSAVLARGLAVVRGLLPWGDVTARTAGVMLE